MGGGIPISGWEHSTNLTIYLSLFCRLLTPKFILCLSLKEQSAIGHFSGIWSSRSNLLEQIYQWGSYKMLLLLVNGWLISNPYFTLITALELVARKLLKAGGALYIWSEVIFYLGRARLHFWRLWQCLSVSYKVTAGIFIVCLTLPLALGSPQALSMWDIPICFHCRYGILWLVTV